MEIEEYAELHKLLAKLKYVLVENTIKYGVNEKVIKNNNKLMKAISVVEEILVIAEPRKVVLKDDKRDCS